MPTVKIPPAKNSNYSRVDFIDHDKKVMMSVVAHRRSNPKYVQLDDRPEKVLGTYEHSHSTIYVAKRDGTMEHALDITHSQEKNQIQVSLDLVFKNVNCRLILRGEDGHYYELGVQKEGLLFTRKIENSEIVKANKNFQQ